MCLIEIAESEECLAPTGRHAGTFCPSSELKSKLSVDTFHKNNLKGSTGNVSHLTSQLPHPSGSRDLLSWGWDAVTPQEMHQRRVSVAVASLLPTLKSR